MELRLKERLEKDVRSKQRGRLTSIWRLKEARAAGYKIPELETAMRNVRIQEEKSKDGEEAHKGQVGQIITAKERRRIERQKTIEERDME